ncbi:alpha-(1,3)-fucosyltransferase 11-like [Haliotis asinina]|uniref:alpha-(1,3)-fucosyltransferase 11-like n=1 Tax=Haliotis asinina TaxID=109174 RepID=UPI00353210FC
MKVNIWFVFMLGCVVPKINIAVKDGYSSSDGKEYEPRSPFNDMYGSHTNQGYGVYNEPGTTHDLPIILWWTDTIFPHFGGKSDKYVIQCGDVSCYTTKYKKYAKSKRTRVFMFYGTDIQPEELPLPRRPYHEWALFHEESPLNNYILSHTPFIELFNHTATFRSESDYPLTSQNIYYVNYLTERKPVDLVKKNDAKKSMKLASVLYVQSHCDVPSDRDRYVKELMKYIDVDSYGECLHNKDLPEHLRDPAENYEKDEFLNFISQYKFHLSFENAICKDYMTEKLMRPLYVGSVPIYKGSSSAKEWMPNNHSVIMVDDFSSPEELAAFIKAVDADDTEYEKYLSFKKTGITNQFLLKHMKERQWHVNENGGFDYFRGFECLVCKRIHERLNFEKDQEDEPDIPLPSPRIAKYSHLGCPQPYPSIGHPGDIPKNDIWHKSDWISQYWGDYDRARAARNMVLAKEKDSKKFFDYYEKVMQKKV